MVSAVVGSGADVVSAAVVVGCVVGCVVGTVDIAFVGTVDIAFVGTVDIAFVGTVDIAVVVCGAPFVCAIGVVLLDRDCRITWSLEKDHRAQDQQVSGSNPPSNC